jgi:uncharacterized protein involved in outer membrane biogenesis
MARGYAELQASISWLRGHLRRLILWTVGLFLVYAVVGFFVLPRMLKPALERNLSEALQRPVSIASLDTDPFAFSATLHDVSIGDRAPGTPLLTLSEVYVNGEAASLFRWAPVINALKLTRPTLHVVRNADKSYNVSDLIEQALAPGPTPRFSLSNIEIVDGAVDFDDQPEHRQHKIADLNVGIPFLSSLPAQTEIKVEPRFSALVNGRPIAITGETRPFKDTRETVLHWDLGGLVLPTYVDYLPAPLPFKLESGQLDARAELSFVARGSAPPQLTLAGSFRFSDVVLNERSGAKLLRVPLLAVAIDRLDLTGGSAELGTVAADGIEINLRRDAGGNLNAASLAPKENAAVRSPAFRFHVGSIAISHGTVHVDDSSVKPAFASTLSDVAIEISNLSSAPDQKAKVIFSSASDMGARTASQGTLSLSPVRADAHVEISGLKLGHLYPYYASALNLAVDDGTLDVTTDLHFDGGSDAFSMSNLEATTSNLKLRLPDEKEPLWRVPVLAVHGGSVDVTKHAISFESIEGRGAVATIRRDADGGINFARLVRAPAPGAAPASAGDAWRVETHKLSLEDYAATLEDAMVSPPARIAMSRVSLSGENLSNVPNARGHATFKATVNKRGALTLSGPIARSPFAATLELAAKDVDLVPFQPYLSRQARVILTSGAASVKGTVELAEGSPQRTAFKGEVSLSDIAMLDEANQSDLLKWKSLTLAAVDAQLEPLAVTIGDITLNDYFARLLLNEKGEFNLQQLGRERPPAEAPPAPTGEAKTVAVASPPGTATTWLKLGKATLSNGNIDYTDHFIRPNYSANLTGLSGNLSSLAFDKPADIELHGNVQGTAPVEISGKINPLAKNLFLDIKASATDIELSPMTPYSNKYVGYGIEKGKLSMKVSYLVEDRKLKAENSIILDQLTFGQKVESPDAIKAPVLLAVALLKDRNGVIKFDLPVGGSLDDPQFSVGGLVFRAIIGLIVKVVTSPFAVLGALSSHGEQLAYIEFAPGSAAIDKTGEDKIKALAKALADRPAIKIDVAGRIDPALDGEGLKRAAVDRQVRAAKFNDLVRSGEPPASVDAVEVQPAEYEALLTRVYRSANITKPRNAIGLPKDLPRAEMEQLLAANAKVSDEDLRSLAARRAQAVRAGLIDGEHVPESKVFLLAPKLDAQGIKDSGKPTRVDFALH